MAIGIHCCKDCAPPKRTPNCHATCEEYLKEKEQYKDDKRKVRAGYYPKITVQSFNESDYIRCKHHKCLKRD